MPQLLYAVLTVFANNFFRQLLMSIGVGIATGAILYTTVSTMISQVISQANSSPYVAFIGLFGIDAGLSIIFSAIVARVYMNSTKISLVKMSK